MPLTRMLALALAIMALAAPSALARPGGPASAAAQAAAEKQQRAQDLRHLAAGTLIDVSPQVSHKVANVYVPPTPATDPSRVYWSYAYQAQKPKAQPVAAPDDGTPWPAILAALAGILLIGGGAAAVVARTRQPLGPASA